LVGCSGPPAPRAFGKTDIDSITKQLQELVAAYNAKDAAKAATLFTSGAMVMPPNASTVHGAESIQQYYVSRFAQGASDLSLQPTHVEGSGVLAYATGDYRLTMALPGRPPQPDRGKFLFVLRDANNRWMLESVMFSSDFAPAPSPAP
jgi:uncharacterized protein (TIGR02246 family)